MGLLDRFKMQKKVFKQDTTQIAEHPGCPNGNEMSYRIFMTITIRFKMETI